MVDILQLLLQDPRVDPSVNDNAPVRVAASVGIADIMEMLLAHPKVDPSALDNEAIREAARGRDDCWIAKKRLSCLGSSVKKVFLRFLKFSITILQVDIT